MSETWKPVVGVSGYEVSDCGNVRSLDRTVFYKQYQKTAKRTFTGKLLARCLQPSGHLKVGLGRKLGRRIFKEIHVLVLEAFIGLPPPGCEARHLDGNPSNNILANLTWGTRAENADDALRHGARPSGERHKLAKLTDSAVRQIRRDRTNSYNQMAAVHGVSKATIAHIMQKRKWRYLE